MGIYNERYVVMASRRAASLEWFLMDLVDNIICLPVRFVKWDAILDYNTWLSQPDGKLSL